MEWVYNDAQNEIVSYIKKSENGRIVVVVNTKNKLVKVNVETDIDEKNILMASGAKIDHSIEFAPYGFIVAKI